MTLLLPLGHISFMAGQGGGAPGGVLLPPGVGLPPFPSWIRTWEGERGGREEGRGRRPPLLALLGLGGEACSLALAASPLPPIGT